MKMERLDVECYSGYRAEETPRRFRCGERWIAVKDVIDRWLAPAHRYFKVLGDDGAVYILRHDAIADLWELTFFSRLPSIPGTDELGSALGRGKEK